MSTEELNEIHPEESAISSTEIAAKGIISAASRYRRNRNKAILRNQSIEVSTPEDVATDVNTGTLSRNRNDINNKSSVDGINPSVRVDNSANSHLIDTANTANPYKFDITHSKPMNSSVDLIEFGGAVPVDSKMSGISRRVSLDQLIMLDDPIKVKKKGVQSQAANIDLAAKPGTVSVDNPTSKVTVDKVNITTGRTPGINTLSGAFRGRGIGLSRFPGIGSSGGAYTTISHLNSTLVKGLKIAREAAKKEIIRSVASLLLPVILIIFILYAVISTIGGAVLAPVAISNLTAYPSDEEDITSSTYDATNYCEDLKEDIEKIPDDPEWQHIDEFRYIPSLSAILAEIDYDGWELQAYLNAKFEKFNSIDVAAEIQSIMDEMFVLNLREIVEIRYFINDDGEEESYEYYILEISLIKTELETVVTKRMDDEQKVMYDLYMTDDLYGSQQGICNPFDFDWRNAVSCHYGNRFIDGEADFHTGMDLSWGGCLGTPIYAGVTGTVTSITTAFPYGNKVDITSSDGTITVRYAHMADGSVSVSTGQPVKAGITKIGGVGSTGWSSGPHLHIEIIKNGQRLDPRYVLSFGKRGIN